MGVSPYTLIGQMITFLIFVVFTMKYVWPPLMGAIEERQKKIRDALTLAENQEQAAASAEVATEAKLADARVEAQEIIANANKRRDEIIAEAANAARDKAEQEANAKREELALEISQARESLRKEVSAIAVAGAGKIINKEIDEKAHAGLIDELASQL